MSFYFESDSSEELDEWTRRNTTTPPEENAERPIEDGNPVFIDWRVDPNFEVLPALCDGPNPDFTPRNQTDAIFNEDANWEPKVRFNSTDNPLGAAGRTRLVLPFFDFDATASGVLTEADRFCTLDLNVRASTYVGNIRLFMDGLSTFAVSQGAGVTYNTPGLVTITAPSVNTVFRLNLLTNQNGSGTGTWKTCRIMPSHSHTQNIVCDIQSWLSPATDNCRYTFVEAGPLNCTSLRSPDATYTPGGGYSFGPNADGELRFALDTTNVVQVKERDPFTPLYPAVVLVWQGECKMKSPSETTYNILWGENTGTGRTTCTWCTRYMQTTEDLVTGQKTMSVDIGRRSGSMAIFKGAWILERYNV